MHPSWICRPRLDAGFPRGGLVARRPRLCYEADRLLDPFLEPMVALEVLKLVGRVQY